jgi:putative ABC transport system permease protein
MTWWRRLWNRHALDTQLDKELRFHIEQHAADLIAQGIDPAEAQRLARLEIGGPEQVKESCRDTRGTRWVDDLTQDVRYGLRSLRQRLGFTAVTVSTLALGIGATTVMFTVINSVLLRPYAYPDPDRLVSVIEQTDFSTQYGNQWAFAYPNYLDCSHETRALTLAAWRINGGTIGAPGDPEYINGLEVSAELFDVLGIPILRGRTFRANEDGPGAPLVAIVSESFSRRHYGTTDSIVGSTLVFESQPYTVIGVLAPGARMPQPSDVITLLGQDTAPRLRNREAHPGLQVWGRLRPGATLPQAQSELALVGSRLAAEFPKSNSGRTFIAEALWPDVGDVGSTLWLLLGAVTLVLLIACANIASLLLARAVSRERELAMRAALGAGRGRLVRQCLTESSLLGLMGGAGGMAIAWFGIRPFIAFWPGSLPRAAEIEFDWRVLAFAFVASVAASVICGLAPALRVPSQYLDRVLRATGRTVAGGSRRLHAAFVVSEVALAIVLLVCAGVLGRTLLKLSSLDPGVNVDDVLVARAALSPAVKTNPAQARAAWDEVLEGIRRVPGVEAVAMVDTVPMRSGNNQLGYSTTASIPKPAEQPIALATSVSPGYLAVMGMRLRAGRFFDTRDRAGSQPAIVVDDTLAQTAFGTTDIVGRQLWVSDLAPGPFEIVGVVGHVRHWGLGSDDQATVRAQLYYPFAQLPDRFVRRWSELMSIAVRTSVPSQTLVEPLRRALRGGSRDQVLYEVRTLEELAAGTIARQRFLLLLFGIFAGLALLLASLGIYGVLAYLTSQRVPEIGVRMALGASTSDVVRLVLGQSAAMVGGGVIAGAVGAVAAARVLRALVDGVSVDPVTFVIMIGVLVAAAMTASAVPARRASRVDATTALRQQ